MMRFLSLLLATCLAGALPAAAQQQLAPLMAKPQRTQIHAENHDRRLVVKFVHGSGVRLGASGLEGPEAHGETLDRINLLFDRQQAHTTRLLPQSEQWLNDWRARAEARSGQRLHDLNLFFLVELPGKETLGAVCDQLNHYELVEIAYPLSRSGDPSAPLAAPWSPPSLIAQPQPLLQPLLPTPDFQNQQGYRTAAPTGIDADYGENFSGALGEGTLIADVETGWTDDHEDIKHAAEGNFIGFPPLHYPWNHGTAVLGELVGEDNGLGVLGIVHHSDVVMSSHQGNTANIPGAIANAANAAGPGDVVVLEVQCYSSAPSPHPCEYDPAIFATVQTATAAGTHVYAAAGNGSNDLDSGAYGGAFDRNVRDSGAVMCGASDGSSLNIAYFSNYGSRLDAHGWGFNVTTAGYGDLYGTGGFLFFYTATFSGTSSATPIVTGAGIMINGIYREAFGQGLDPLALRDLLISTGTPQGSGGQIGPRPNVRAALESLNMPRIAVGGNLVPGGTVTVTLNSEAGESYALGFSPDLLAVPDYLPPYGYRFLDNLDQTVFGTIPVGGQEVLNFPIPNNSSLSGKTVGYIQGAVTFTGRPGTGTFTNVLPVEIE